MSKQLVKRKRPIICTACNTPFRSWPDWLEHRAVIRSWEMHRYDNHTRRCLSEHDWAMMVLAEAQGVQEANLSNRQEDDMPIFAV
jgi:hypothetical protein